MKSIKGLLVVVLIVVGFTANAQFKFGLGGGLNMSNLGGSDISNTDSRLGFNGGLMMEVKLPIKLGVELDVLFSSKGAKMLGSSDGMKLSYIDLPVVMKIYMAKVISFQLGAQYSMLLSAKSSGFDVKDELKPSDLSAVLGLGVDVLKLHVSARYNYGLTSIDDAGADIKNNMLTFSVGYWIK
tara:strand:+ start:2477 stop:3025 length:549 start_codon:yes stop_codon:yes gene_type:complete